MKELAIDITVPVHGVPIETAISALTSAVRSAGPNDRVLAILDGPQSYTGSDLEAGVVDGHVDVVQFERLGLVHAWNKALDLATRDLVHVLHCDERVSPGFHASARRAFALSDQVQLFAAPGRREFNRTPGVRLVLLEGLPALETLVTAAKPPAGGFVIRTSAERFDPLYPYCPDEEMFARLAASGVFAVAESECVVPDRSGGRARRGTWLESDWVDTYFAARLKNAASFGPGGLELARSATARAALSVVARLLETGHDSIASNHIDRIAALAPEISHERRFRLARSATRHSWLGGLFRLRARAA